MSATTLGLLVAGGATRFLVACSSSGAGYGYGYGHHGYGLYGMGDRARQWVAGIGPRVRVDVRRD